MQYKALKDFDKSGLVIKVGDLLDLEPEDAQDLPVCEPKDWVKPEVKAEKKASKK